MLKKYQHIKVRGKGLEEFSENMSSIRNIRVEESDLLISKGFNDLIDETEFFAPVGEIKYITVGYDFVYSQIMVRLVPQSIIDLGVWKKYISH